MLKFFHTSELLVEDHTQSGIVKRGFLRERLMYLPEYISEKLASFIISRESLRTQTRVNVDITAREFLSGRPESVATCTLPGAKETDSKKCELGTSSPKWHMQIP